MIDAVQGREYLLIERVAEELAQVALRNPLVDHVTVSREEAAAGAGPRVGGGADHAGPMKVVSNTAISLDGRINTRERRFAFFGSERDHARMSRLRAEADAVLVGGATFRNWPHRGAARRGRSRSAARPAVERGRQPLARPAARRRLLRRAGDPAAAARPAPRRSPGAPCPRRRGRRLAGRRRRTCRSPGSLEQLARRGVEHLLVEAGGDLLFQFIAADAIDEMYLTLCPLVVGGDAPSLADGAGFDLAELRRLRLVAAEPVGDEVFLHYRATAEGASR